MQDRELFLCISAILETELLEMDSTKENKTTGMESTKESKTKPKFPTKETLKQDRKGQPCYEEANQSLLCQQNYSSNAPECAELIDLYKKCRQEKVSRTFHTGITETNNKQTKKKIGWSAYLQKQNSERQKKIEELLNTEEEEE